MLKEDKLSVLKKISSLEKNFFYSRFSNGPSKQKWKPKKDEVGGSRKLQNRAVPDVVVEFESMAASILQSPNVLVLQENVKIQ